MQTTSLQVQKSEPMEADFGFSTQDFPSLTDVSAKAHSLTSSMVLKSLKLMKGSRSS